MSSNLSLSLLEVSQGSSKLGWTVDSFSQPSVSALEMTLSGLAPGFIVPNFFATEECDALVRAVNESGMQNYKHVAANVSKFGLVQMEYNTPEAKKNYFDQVRFMNGDYNRVLKDLPNPVENVIELLVQITSRDCRIAEEPELGSYFAGTFRHVKGAGLTHFDFGSVETRGWAISRVIGQLSWNIYLSDPVEGGELVVYEKQWSPASEQYKSDSYWYHSDAVNGGKRVVYKPRKGDLVIFNSVNFHEIKKPKFDRFTVSSFIGLTPENQLLLWS
jgi:hypothetical protein